MIWELPHESRPCRTSRCDSCAEDVQTCGCCCHLEPADEEWAANFLADLVKDWD